MSRVNPSGVMGIALEVVVRFTVEAWHRWPNAPKRRRYQADKHRHLLHVEVAIWVEHDDREIEFHDLLDFCRRVCPQGDVGAASCEMVALALCSKLRQEYGSRPMSVAVFEDGEVGARVTCTP